jgi:hypothetical protein
MKSFASLACIVLVALALPAAQNGYVDGKIVHVEDKVKSTVIYYQVDTPITRDDPYYEITVQVKDIAYKGIYTPRHAKDLLPPEWIPGASVKVKIDGRHMTLLTPGEHEIETAIASRTVDKVEQPGSAPAARP